MASAFHDLGSELHSAMLERSLGSSLTGASAQSQHQHDGAGAGAGAGSGGNAWLTKHRQGLRLAHQERY